MKFMKCILFASLFFVASFSLAEEKQGIGIEENTDSELQFQIGFNYFSLANNLFRTVSNKDQLEQIAELFKQTEFWLTKAAEQNHAMAQFYLVNFYLVGIDGFIDFDEASVDELMSEDNFIAYKQNLPKSFYWAEQAVNQGDSEIQYEIAELFLNSGKLYLLKSENTDLIEKIIDKALVWLKQSNEQGI